MKNDFFVQLEKLYQSDNGLEINPKPPDIHGYINTNQAMRRYSLGPRTLNDWIKNSDMPPVIRLASGVAGWELAELETWETGHQLWKKIGKVRRRRSWK